MFYRRKLPLVFAILCMASAPSAWGEPLVNLKNIVLDPGHGGKDPGAKNPNIPLEKDFTLQLAVTLKRLIEKENGDGVKVRITRPGRDNVTQDERAYTANAAQNGLYLSIHAASGFDEESRDLGIYISTGKKWASWKTANSAYADDNEKFAVCLFESLKDFYRHKSFVVRRGEFIPLFGIDMPGAIVEAASLNDPRDELTISGNEFFGNMAGSLYRAIVMYDGSL